MNEAASPESHHLYIGLGSNIDPELNLPRALDLLRRSLEILAFSSIWETPAAGSEGPPYLNLALHARTALDAGAVKQGILREIEDRLGRVRTADKNSPRTIDLDILIADGEVLEPKLWERYYEAAPLAELLPDYTNPESGETLSQAARRLSRGLSLRRVDPEALSLDLR